MKKFYATPTFEVVVLNMSDTICTSPVNQVDGQNNPFSMGGRGTSSRANNRNDIWGDE